MPVIRMSFATLNQNNVVPLVRSHLDYATYKRSTYKQKQKDTITNLQVRASNQLIGNKDFRYQERLDILKLLVIRLGLINCFKRSTIVMYVALSI